MSRPTLRAQPLFHDMFPLPTPEKQGKGRSETFDHERNRLLITRYYYYGITTGFRFDVLIKIISKQFFLSERTVNNVLSENRDILKEVRGRKPEKNDLIKEWPYLNWDTPALEYYL